MAYIFSISPHELNSDSTMSCICLLFEHLVNKLLRIHISNSLGVWPWVYACVILVDGQNQPFNGGLAALLSNVFGGFVLLPYCALRRTHNGTRVKQNFLVRVLESKTLSALLMMATISLLLFAAIFGDFRLFLHEFHTNRFVHIMSTHVSKIATILVILENIADKSRLIVFCSKINDLITSYRTYGKRTDFFRNRR